MAFDEAMPTPDPGGNKVDTMSAWEAYWVGGLGGAAGVIAGVGGELSPSINSGARTVSAASGAALVRGFYVNNPSTYTVGVPTQSAGDRVDRLVLRLDRTASAAADWLKPIILQGTSGSTTAPALAATDNASWDLPVARWTTKANATLTGLVDERYLLGGSFVEFKSTARPAASPPRLGRETDTGRLLLANGSAWSAVIDDTGWVVLNATGLWQNGGFAPKIRRIGSVVYLKGSLARTTNTLFTSDEDSGCLQVPSGFIPAESHNWATWSNPSQALRMWLDTSGLVHVTQHTVNIPVGGNVYLDTTYMIG